MVKIICTENGDNNRTEIALGGDMDLVVSQIGYAIKTIYTNVREQDKNAAEEFRVKLTRAIASKGTPTWSTEPCEDATLDAALVRKGAKLTGDDIADLLRRGTPKDIIKSLLEEMELTPGLEPEEDELPYEELQTAVAAESRPRSRHGRERPETTDEFRPIRPVHAYPESDLEKTSMFGLFDDPYDDK